jgi:hypothetical protein
MDRGNTETYMQELLDEIEYDFSRFTPQDFADRLEGDRIAKVGTLDV